MTVSDPVVTRCGRPDCGRGARTRSDYTGESHQAIVQALRDLPAGAPPIPRATSLEQALLENQILRRTRGLACVSPNPLGIARVTPHADTLTIQLEPQPYVVRHWAETLLPFDDGPACEIGGICGLRYRVEHHAIHLTVDHPHTRATVRLTGFPVRWWENAVSALLTTSAVQACWLQRPHDWTDAERDLHMTLTSFRHQDVHLGSGLLRRIRATAFPGGYGGTEVWSHPAGRHRWEWVLELIHRPDDTQLLDMLTDPVFGLPLTVSHHICYCGMPGGNGCTALLTSVDGTQDLHVRNMRWQRDHSLQQRIAEANAQAFNPDR